MNKICCTCKNSFDTSFFYKRSSAKDGLSPKCNACQTEYNKAYRLANKERLDAQSKQWCEQNKEHVKRRKQLNYMKNAEVERVKRREHYSENRALYLHYSKLRKYRISRASPS
jgi:hypothetical protein